jgi:ribonucleoside-diphosphate reductase alpha chain
MRHYINGEWTIEGAPHLQEEHYAIFDCANKTGKGKRFINVNGHIDMLGNQGIGPFLSGGASKTVNLPAEATIEDVSEAYMRAWKEGAKVVAIYPDGAKLSQPLNAAVRSDAKPKLEWGAKNDLPPKRTGITLEVVRGEGGKEQKLYMRTGEYPNGRIGELFIDTLKEGSPFKAALNAFAIEASDAFKHGRGLEKFVKKYLYVEADPRGPVEGHPFIVAASSIYDLVAKALGIEYLGIDTFEELFGTPKGVRPRPDPSTLRITEITEWNRFKQYMRIVKGEHLKDATREARAKKKKKQTLVENNGAGKEGAVSSGRICTRNNCGGIIVRAGTCETCTRCGFNEGCG